MLWKKPRMILVNSMSDLFHKNIVRKFIDAVFVVMEQADWHVYHVLTKRSALMRNCVWKRYDGGAVPCHIGLGVSVGDAAHASRIEHLKQINSDARFISFEPPLGPVGDVGLQGVAWAIARESGPRARSMDESWARRIRDICERDDVAFFFKQWGGARPKSGVICSMARNGTAFRAKSSGADPRSDFSVDHLAQCTTIIEEVAC